MPKKPATKLSDRKQVLSISIDPDLLQQIEQDEPLNRSKYVVALIRKGLYYRELERNNGWETTILPHK